MFASVVGVSEQQVKIWYQNRRTKWKKQENISSQEAIKIMKMKTTGRPDIGGKPEKMNGHSNHTKYIFEQQSY